MKTTKILCISICSETICCPYCKTINSPPEEFYELDIECSLNIVHTCEKCKKKYLINGIDCQ